MAADGNIAWRASHTFSNDQISRSIRKLFETVGTVESWNMDTSQSSDRVRVIARFSGMEEANKAVKEFNGKVLVELKGSKINISHSVSDKFSIFTELHTAAQQELIDLLPRLPGENYASIKAYHQPIW